MAKKHGNWSGQSASPSENKSGGSILIITLWTICFLSALAVSLGFGIRQKIALLGRIDERDRLSFIAEAGVKRAIIQIKKEGDKIYDSLQDAWSNDPTVFSNIDINGGRFNVFYNLKNELSGYAELRFGLVDEESKININSADMVTLEHLFKIALGLEEMQAQELAASIVDWRDADSELSIPLGSAEGSYYRDLSYPYDAKNEPIEVLDELLLVKGISQDIFFKLKDYVTIYGDGKVNVNTASKVVLMALGLNEALADKIIAFRYGADGILNTQDDNVFKATSEILPKLSQFSSLSDSEAAKLSTVVDRFLATKSNNFTVRSAANLNNRKNTLEVTCVISRSGKILYWLEV